MNRIIARHVTAGALLAVTIATSAGVAAAPSFTDEFPIEK
jgi:hypothetical protein